MNIKVHIVITSDEKVPNTESGRDSISLLLWDGIKSKYEPAKMANKTEKPEEITATRAIALNQINTHRISERSQFSVCVIQHIAAVATLWLSPALLYLPPDARTLYDIRTPPDDDVLCYACARLY